MYELNYKFKRKSIYSFTFQIDSQNRMVNIRMKQPSVKKFAHLEIKKYEYYILLLKIQRFG